MARKLDVKSGQSARGEWAKQEFIVEFEDGKFTSQAVFNVWGQDRVEDLRKYNVGDKVKVAFSVSSREYNGRWYTDLRAYRITSEGQAAPQQPTYATGPVPPAPTIDDMPADKQGDDLPF